MKLSLLTVAATGLLAVSQSQAATVLNGSFEDPTIPNPSFNVFANIPGWTGAGAGIELQNHVAGTPLDGDQFVELDSFSNSSMSQVLTTTPGTLYTLSFYYSPRPGVSADSNIIIVTAGGSAPQTYTGAGAGDTVWTQYSIDFLGTGSDTITFTASGVSDSLGGYIDNVSVADARVPDGGSTLAMLGGVFLGLGAIMKRRKAA